MNAPLISVIIPVYNKEKTIEKCVDSVLQQNYPNFEIILVDDGSRDKSYDRCVKLSQADPRIKVLHQENRGVSAARNAGLKSAGGEFVSFVDSDDWIHPEMLGTLLGKIDHQTDICCSCCFAVLENRLITEHFFDGDIITEETFESKRPLIAQLLDTSYGQPRDEIYTGIGVPWAKLYRKSLFAEETYYFDEELSHLEDNFLNLQLFWKARKIAYIDVPLYYYSTEHIQTVLKKYDRKVVFSYAKVSVLRYAWFEKEGLFQDVELKKLLDRETIQLLNIAVIGMTFDSERSLTKKERLAELRWLNENIGLCKVLHNMDLHMATSPVARVAYYFLAHKQYLFVYGCLMLRNKLKS